MQGTVAIVLSLVLGLVGRFILSKTKHDPVKSRNICLAVIGAKLIASGLFIWLEVWYTLGFTLLVCSIWAYRAWKFQNELTQQSEALSGVGGMSESLI